MSYVNWCRIGALICAFSAQAVAQMNNQASTDQPFVGIGMAFERSSDNWMHVGGVLPDGPAAKAGIVAGDYVLAIDGTDVRQLSDDEIPNRIKGEKGTEVTLVVISAGQQKPREIKVRRDVIPPRNAGQQPQNPAPGPAPAPRARGDNPLDPKHGAPAPNTGPVPAQSGVQKFSLLTITDPAVMNTPAVQVMVPQGWDAKGQIVWMHNFSMLTNLDLLVRDPKTGVAIQWLPIQSFTYTPNPPFPVQDGSSHMGRYWLAPIRDPAQFVGAFWGNNLPHLRGAKIVAGEEFPKQSQYYLAQLTGNGNKQVRSVRIRYEFAGPNQQPWEEDVFFTLAFNDIQVVVSWDVIGAASVRGPKGSLDQMKGVTQTVLNSTQFTPQWLATRQICQQIFREGLQQEQRDQQVMAQKLQQYRDHIQQLSQQISDDRMKSSDARNESFREVLGGVENYKDPFQHQNVYLPAGYKEYWANSKGEYVLSDQTGYNPNVGTTEDWRKIDRVDPMGR